MNCTPKKRPRSEIAFYYILEQSLVSISENWIKKNTDTKHEKSPIKTWNHFSFLEITRAWLSKVAKSQKNFHIDSNLQKRCQITPVCTFPLSEKLFDIKLPLVGQRIANQKLMKFFS